MPSTLDLLKPEGFGVLEIDGVRPSALIYTHFGGRVLSFTLKFFLFGVVLIVFFENISYREG